MFSKRRVNYFNTLMYIYNKKILIELEQKPSGSSCSKIMMWLVNVSLKLGSLNTAYHMLIFLLKKCE